MHHRATPYHTLIGFIDDNDEVLLSCRKNMNQLRIFTIFFCFNYWDYICKQDQQKDGSH